MTIKQFIEKAYPKKEIDIIEMDYVYIDGARNNVHKIVLDPLAWKAVGKVEGWVENDVYGRYEDLGSVGKNENVHLTVFKKGWKVKMYKMIDALIEGKSIEQYIETL